MRIKQIELNGFKSFMDRTVLELPLGVTAIVGPNGCGKSNIVDAIRWVLGEQSPKHLRGDVMEDVIFSGNADDGPLGMAEVSLLMERDQGDLARAAAEAAEGAEVEGALPSEIANVSEVLVTRRYFRSGESEYFINRAPCRLKDITELFLGTGVGTKAYAIIEQGRIEQLVNAKPEELRLFIEEAAGVTRFRHRKIAAERKMERTRENLVRVQDVLRELERQKSSLERQARRAEEYHRIKDELRALDLRVMAARQRRWSAESTSLRERLASLHQEEAAAQQEIHRASNATDDVRARRLASEERLRAVEGEITELRLAAGEAQTRAASVTERRTELCERVAAAGREEAEIETRRAALGSEIQRLETESARLGEERSTAAAEEATAEARLKELESAGRPLEHAVEEAKDRVLDALADEVRLRNMVAALRERREELEGRRRKLEEEQQQLGERLQTNARAREDVRGTMQRLASERARHEAERQALAERQEVQHLEEMRHAGALEAARGVLTQLRSRADSLRELQARYEGCTRGAASLVSHDADAALLASVLRVPPALERAVAAALGARLGQVVVADTRTAIAAVHWLRDNGGGRATVLPRDPERRATVIVPPGRRLLDQIEVDPQHWSLAEAVLGQVLLADDLEQALALWRDAAHAVTVVTLTGEALDPLGALAGGSEPPLEEILLARARELRELEDTLSEQERRVAIDAKALAVVREQLAARTADIATADDQLHALHLQQVASEKDRERLDEEHARITAELEVSALEATGLAGADGQAAEELEALDRRRARAETAVVERRAELAACQEELVRWREEVATIERARTAAEVRSAAVTERARGVETEVARARSSMADTEQRLAAVRQQAAAAAAGAAAAEAEGSRATATHRDATTRIAALGGERDQLRVAIAEAETTLSADDLAERAARARLEACREERSRLEVVLAERRLELEHLSGQLAERYGLELSALDALPEDGEIGEEQAERVETLRRRLAQLGDVNPAALSELDELKTRHEFLTVQRADLERSLDDLRRTINRLTRTSRQRFEETFEAANEKLAEVFPKLFPGGKARLELTTPEEGGEPGVEIVVQPAGKKLQALSLLSGGEKALTATALVFSLFLTRPTPFCLLDEVDAPLDEANIGRFNQLVSDMAQRSQFVLITHNRRTMEVADTLYGITMERPGVSKIVSVRLREAA